MPALTALWVFNCADYDQLCAVLGVALLNIQNKYSFIESVKYGVTGGLGFMLVIVLFASIRERLEFSEVPKCFEGFPIALITAVLWPSPYGILRIEGILKA